MGHQSPRLGEMMPSALMNEEYYMGKELQFQDSQTIVRTAVEFLPVKHDGLQELMQNFNSDQSMLLEKNLKLLVVKLSKMWVQDNLPPTSTSIIYRRSSYDHVLFTGTVLKPQKDKIE
ncbi:hypothetical protein SADUNF_Sadunf13G0104100 [Salix dunnii]|uniref:Uncharacterized protein n=1 Tax=Salix dunnii TaxID=1413687 RepID=A0A835MV66_9ROSI|nr:hypothetical protein SADUNF_Sadunf13G0104100 [Salix dunnii]